MHYNRDSNKVPNSKTLQHMSFGLDIRVQDMVTTLVDLIGQHDRMLYPDRHAIPRIPADEYEKETADKALSLAKQIINYVSDVI